MKSIPFIAVIYPFDTCIDEKCVNDILIRVRGKYVYSTRPEDSKYLII